MAHYKLTVEHVTDGVTRAEEYPRVEDATQRAHELDVALVCLGYNLRSDRAETGGLLGLLNQTRTYSARRSARVSYAVVIQRIEEE